VIERPVVARVIALDDATLRFAPATDGRGEGLGGLDLACADPARVLVAAQSRGVPTRAGAVLICGIRFRPVSAAPTR
jgi:hypothetical protein